MRKNLIKRIPLLLMSLLLTMSISSVYLSFTEAKVHFVGLLFFGAIAVALVECITWNKWTVAASGILVLLHIICSFADVPVLHSMAMSLNACAWDTYMKVFWTDRTAFVNESGTIFLVLFVICLSVHILYAKRRSAFFSTLVMVVYIFFMEFYKVGTDFQVMLNLFLMLAALVVLYAQRWYCSGETRSKKKISLRYGMPVLCGILILSLVFTSIINTEPNREFQNWLNKHFSNLPSTGIPGMELPEYQSIFEKEDGALGGNIFFGNQHLFSVSVGSVYGDTLQENSVYLRGVACDFFENDTWYTAIDDDKERLLTDYFSGNLYFCGDGRASFVQDALAEGMDFYGERWFTVQYDAKSSETIFNHTLTTSIGAYNVDSSGMILETADVYYDNSTYTYHQGNVNWYDVFYVELNRDSAALDAFIADSSAASYDQAAMDSSLKNQVKTYYLQMPADISGSVAALAERLTGAYPNDYEKAAAIESYLKENYTYTLKPGNVPEDKNLVEYFLFESKQGYCVYFASSMVMLCRSVGIPARYVKGYRADGIHNGGQVSVKDSNAHAWVEVLIPNLGWVTFDPVSGNSFQQNTGTNAPDRGSPTPNKPSPTPNRETPTPTLSGVTATPSGNTATPETATPESGVPQTETPQTEVPDTQTTPPQAPASVSPTASTEPNTNHAIVWVIGIIGLLLAAGIAVFLWKRHLITRQKAAVARPIQTAAIRIYQRMLCVYTFLALAPETGETVAQYVERLENPELAALVPVLEDCFYHQGVMTKEQYKAFVTALRQVEARAVQEKGKLKWKWFRWNFRRKTLTDKS